MFVCEIHSTQQKIGGIFKASNLAEKCLTFSANAKIIPINLDLPFFIVETNDVVGVKFDYVSCNAVVEAVNSLERNFLDNPYYSYMTIYGVTEEHCSCECDTIPFPHLPFACISNEWLKEYDINGKKMIDEFWIRHRQP